MSSEITIFYNSCFICLDNDKNDEPFTTIKLENGTWVTTQIKECIVPGCGHALHKACLSKYLLHEYRDNKEPDCPVCRKKTEWLDKNQLKEIVREMELENTEIPEQLKEFSDTLKQKNEKETSRPSSKRRILKLVTLGAITALGGIGVFLFAKKRKNNR